MAEALDDSGEARRLCLIFILKTLATGFAGGDLETDGVGTGTVIDDSPRRHVFGWVDLDADPDFVADVALVKGRLGLDDKGEGESEEGGQFSVHGCACITLGHLSYQIGRSDWVAMFGIVGPLTPSPSEPT